MLNNYTQSMTQDIKIKAIIVDDEPKARRVLSNSILQFCPNIELVAICEDVLEAIEQIKTHKPDVLFLDIEMPNYSGFELLDLIGEVNFEIIFVTAYNQHALKAFEVSAIDYLLKPLRIDKLELAVEKLQERIQVRDFQKCLSVLKDNLKQKELKKLIVSTQEGMQVVKIEHIISIIADGSYSKIIIKNSSPLLISKNLKFFSASLLEEDGFYRVHRSYIVNIHSVLQFQKNKNLLLLENNQEAKVSRDKKVLIQELLKQK
jgi:two-component system LytT family response regulator